MSALAAEGVGIDFGGVRAVDNVSFTTAEHGVTAIIGPNGAGKTTLFNMLSGVYRPGRGRVRLFGEDVTGEPPHRLAARGLSRTFQNLQIFFQMTALENVMVGNHLGERHNVWRHLLPLPGVFAEEKAARQAARKELQHVGLADVADRPASSLAYGMLKRLEIARALVAKPRVLLLDEPAAGCNATETEALSALIRRLAGEGLAIVLVEHDMAMVMSLSDRVVVLDQGRVIADGAPEAVRADPAVRAAYLGVEV
ncbi:ABC transporter ATP-binding protein [Acuticoccus mangrovi]|uniref:ABC transporter ATP-binding protein n=1 Tax=Acuticoccus mangrovi TaxID=2796142 RepID=A0A934IK91_9HYPH|nr:ABC transporter ATP-binding protein [Acuticoccus mangrovi]MBJ3778204.1 ABC transporter ATP-binding protein [Acuticoccus mangrovi]